jgi:hypothetical protein
VNIEIKSWYTGEVLWAGEGIDLKDGVQKAVAAGVSLAGVNLAGASLRDACLVGASLAGANLARADLAGAILAGTDLAGASLVGANLTNVNFTGASLAYTRIDEPICRMDFGGWSICIRANVTTIGCQRYANSEWLKWTSESEEIASMHEDAPAWWATHGDAVKAVIKCVMRKEHEVAR